MLFARDLYLDLLKRSVGDFIYDFDKKNDPLHPQNQCIYVDVRTGQKQRDISYEELKEHGLTVSETAHTIIGMKRLNQLQEAIETLIQEDVPGDLIETGVLRGGGLYFYAWGT